MIYNILFVLKWLSSIGRKIFSVSFGMSQVIVITTLVSQLSLLLAFFLPLKVLILLSSSGVPHYFPESFQLVERDVLVIALSGAAVGFYVVYLLADKVIEWLTRRGAQVLLNSSGKMALFSNQSEIIENAFQRFSRALAGSVFMLLAIGILGYIYPELLFIIVTYMLLVLAIIATVYRLSVSLRDRLSENPMPLVNMMGGVGFLLSFAFMVYEFLNNIAPSFLIAIIALLVTRQMLMRLNGIVGDLRALYAKRLQINALLFHGHQLTHNQKPHDENFWSMQTITLREQWIRNVIRRAIGGMPNKIHLEWMQTGVLDVIGYKVTIHDAVDEESKDFLIKLFNRKCSVIAQHEASLLLGMPDLPSLSLLAVDEVEGFHCHLFQWRKAEKLSAREINNIASQFVIELMKYKPPESLIEHYLRSHPTIWQRLDVNFLSRLQLISETLDATQQGLMSRLANCYDDIRSRLQSIPLSILNPDLRQDNLLRSSDGEFVNTHWGRWSIEPLGAGWSLKPNQLSILGETFKNLLENRDDMQDVCEDDIRLAALAFGFEKLCQRQNYLAAFELLPKILDCVEIDKSIPLNNDDDCL